MWGCGSSIGETVAQRKAWQGQGWRGKEECAVFFSPRGVWVWKRVEGGSKIAGCCESLCS